jgi:hypothetical protein
MHGACTDPGPIFRQIAVQIEDAIVDGSLPAESQAPDGRPRPARRPFVVPDDHPGRRFRPADQSIRILTEFLRVGAPPARGPAARPGEPP